MRKQLQKQQRKPRFKQILIASRGKKKGKPTNIVIYHSHKNPNIGKVKFKLLNIGYTPGKISKLHVKYSHSQSGPLLPYSHIYFQHSFLLYFREIIKL